MANEKKNCFKMEKEEGGGPYCELLGPPPFLVASFFCRSSNQRNATQRNATLALKERSIRVLIYNYYSMANTTIVTCGLSRSAVLELHRDNSVPLVDGCCNNWARRDGVRERCGVELGAHYTSEIAPAPAGIYLLLAEIFHLL